MMFPSHLHLNRSMIRCTNLVALLMLLFLLPSFLMAGIDLTTAVVFTREGDLPEAEATAALVLQEEVEARTGIRWPGQTSGPTGKTVIVVAARSGSARLVRDLPAPSSSESPELKPEGYRILVDPEASPNPVVWVVGADPRGALYGVGRLLRLLELRNGSVLLPEPVDMASSPAYPIRGHQLGFRARANSWDAWDGKQFEQYIRELAVFGLNSVENIPFQDERQSPLMKMSRDEANRMLSEICGRYGLDYWVWTPVDFDLNNTVLRERMLDKHERFYHDCNRLNGVFFPGGDPGHNPPELVLPFLEDVAERLLAVHPEARVWLSLQWFNRQQIDTIYAYQEKEKPSWLGGLVAGPSSPPIPLTRERLPEQYKYRLYPDITHNKLCQYPVRWWDQAFALTLGREAINPRPVEYAQIHNRFAPYTDGFISYSDGVHDDVNKTIWSVRSWDPGADVREILSEYSRFFFGPDVDVEAADGILALEKNWQGPLATNGSVDGTLLLWQRLEAKAPQLSGNWRWQMNLVRAYYDAYTRHRLIYERNLEQEANTILAQAPVLGASAAMKQALEVLNRGVSNRARPELLRRIEELCEALFQSISLQTSVEQYHASGAERGAFLDFVNYPLNNRWWLQDEFKEIAFLPGEAEKLERLAVIQSWESPGPGSYYDDIGHAERSPRVLRFSNESSHPRMGRTPSPTFWWWDNGMSRERLSWQSTMSRPLGVVYGGLDPEASYTVRLTGYGKSLLRMDDVLVEPTVNGKEIGEFKEFPVAPETIQDRKLVLTWDRPTDEGHLNWRQRSRVAEVWLLKR